MADSSVPSTYALLADGSTVHIRPAATPLLTQEALFGQAGIIAAHSLGELVETAAMLPCQPLPAGPRVAIVSNAGGTGVLAADACADVGLSVAVLTRSIRVKPVPLCRVFWPRAPAVAGCRTTGAPGCWPPTGSPW